MLTFKRIVACLLVMGILGFLGFLSWFAVVWGFSPFIVFPWWMLGLILCVITVVILWRR